MHRKLDELSDDESKSIKVTVSSVLGPRLNSWESSAARAGINGASSSQNGARSLPTLDSFAFYPTGNTQDLPDEDGSPMVSTSRKRTARKYVVLDESSDEDFDPIQQKRKKARIEKEEACISAPQTPTSERCDGLQDGDSSLWNEVSAVNENVRNDEAIARLLQEEEERQLSASICVGGDDTHINEGDQYIDLDSQVAEVDLIGNTLQKCDQIAASLRRELKVGATTELDECMDRYAEVDASAAKIVSQEDVSAACRSADIEHLVLKPYQLVGVNFLMLLHRKNVGGDLRDETNAELMAALAVENADLMGLLWLKNADLRDEKNADLMVLLWLKSATLRGSATENADMKG
ncbi:hypothetical protein L7F22_009541 [Adiantum nelumboides]|nr:hypothetical protein [Adiantum nelumboides]